ncbi:dihydrodipicolinate synthase family protein [Microbacterium karelineae]|uniref:dihydrodipicolinate synthase family protein n=1 Tax=Microbacterium karelineae TaxID=2654283 RepID=UPI0012EA8130|nr:dihydrodipicolinate synthase family protein [Microbacterium karelineae]
MPFTGLSAFPLTPLADDELDEHAYAAQIGRLSGSGVDSITALGSTGSYAYLSRAERARAIRIAVDNAGDVPVLAGVGALRTSDVVAHADDAERAGVAGILVAPVSYQPLTDDEVFGLFQDVTRSTELPVIVYDNPRTTRYAFSLEMYERVADLPGIASIKIPGVPTDPAEAGAHIAAIRARIPARVTVGVSGDAFAAAGLDAGCDTWFSVLAGTLPAAAMRIVDAADRDAAHAESERLRPLWDLYAEAGGGLRVMAAIAEQLRWATRSCLPRPLHGLDDEQRRRLARILDELELLPR